MTPYYQDDWVTIFHGDCREILPGRGASVLITDPPYGVGMADFDDDFDAGCEGVNLCPANRAAVFQSPRRVFDFVRQVPSWRFERLLWMHKSADIAAPWRGWCMNSEAICVLSRRRDDWPQPETYRSDLYTVGPWERAGHPNGKPVSVIGDLIARLSLPHESVIDPFMGSGTTLVAAKAHGRRAFGIEIEERYCEIAARRCAQEVLALGLSDVTWADED